MKNNRYTISQQCKLAILAAMTTATAPSFAETSSNQLQSEIEKINIELNSLENKLAFLEQENKATVPPKGDAKFYATLRPTFGYVDSNGEEVWDVRDALSHAGFKSTYQIMDGWTATVHGEWNITLADNGDFGSARQVYVATESAIGRIGIGKQRPTQYLLIAEYVDIFNHASSPFAYDSESVFFVNNVISYSKKFGNFTYLATAQFNGEEGSDSNDLVNTGISYDTENLHLAVTYLDQKIADGSTISRKDEVWAGAIAYTFDSGLYTAVAYQDKTYEDLSGSDRSGSTLDTSIAYPFAEQYKIKAGYFNFDDGIEGSESGDYDGYNLTFEWQPTSSLRLHVEYLNRDFDFSEDFNSVSVGLRYDFSIMTNYN